MLGHASPELVLVRRIVEETGCRLPQGGILISTFRSFAIVGCLLNGFRCAVKAPRVALRANCRDLPFARRIRDTSTEAQRSHDEQRWDLKREMTKRRRSCNSLLTLDLDVHDRLPRQIRH